MEFDSYEWENRTECLKVQGRIFVGEVKSVLWVVSLITPISRCLLAVIGSQE